jgi:hypothetical protein
VNGRLWFIKKLPPNIVPHQMYFMDVENVVAGGVNHSEGAYFLAVGLQ